MNKQQKLELILSITKLVRTDYLFPEMADKIANYINNKLNAGDYEAENDPEELAKILTQDLQSISNDLHLRVSYDPENKIGNFVEDIAKRIELSRKENYGFKEVKILEGNIGYLKLSRFETPQNAGDTAAAAMNFLSNSDALIIDIRENRGGNAPMVELLTSYFFRERKHLNSFVFRSLDEVHQTYTMPHVQGKQMPNIELYILINKKTVSAAEAFCYNLKHLKRATLVGTPTAGAAHIGGFRTIDKFKIYIPEGYSTQPNTGTNWEGTGVIPHIETDEKDALATAHQLALHNLKNKRKDNNGGE